MNYVDGFVIPVPSDKLAQYRSIARKAAKVFLEHGALEVHECAADDVKPGKRTSFPQAVKLKEGETVVFSWIVYANRKARDRISAKVMADPRFAEMMEACKDVMDGKRMFWGGFKEIVSM